jgi:hypothetical protein
MALNARYLAGDQPSRADGTPAARRRTPVAHRTPVDTSGLTDEQLDGVLMLILDDPNAELPGLADCLARNEHAIAAAIQPPSEHLESFMRAVEQRGLIKQERPLSWREYLGALLPLR